MLALLCIVSSFPPSIDLEQYFLFFSLPYNCCFLSTFHMNQFCITVSTIVFKRRDEDSYELYQANYIRLEINAAKLLASSIVQGVTWLPDFMIGQIKNKEKKALKYSELSLIWTVLRRYPGLGNSEISKYLEEINRKAIVHSHQQKFIRHVDSNCSPGTHFNKRHT